MLEVKECYKDNREEITTNRKESTTARGKHYNQREKSTTVREEDAGAGSTAREENTTTRKENGATRGENTVARKARQAHQGAVEKLQTCFTDLMKERVELEDRVVALDMTASSDQGNGRWW